MTEACGSEAVLLSSFCFFSPVCTLVRTGLGPERLSCTVELGLFLPGVCAHTHTLAMVTSALARSSVRTGCA